MLMQPPPANNYDSLDPDYAEQDLAYADDDFDREFNAYKPSSEAKPPSSKPGSNPVFSDGMASTLNPTSSPSKSLKPNAMQ